jgi:prefoldin subunit 5
MPADEIPLPERIAAHYAQLCFAAADLNAVSDELGKSITDIDMVLKQLNLGISVWVKLYGGDGVRYNDTSFWSRDLGYAKVDGKWGICLRKLEGDFSEPDEPAIEEWLFNEAPRSLRLEAIEKIPELLEKLSSEATKTTKEIRAKLAEAKVVATAIKDAARKSKQGEPTDRAVLKVRAEQK